jgi:hypothetical protein
MQEPCLWRRLDVCSMRRETPPAIDDAAISQGVLFAVLRSSPVALYWCTSAGSVPHHVAPIVLSTGATTYFVVV